MGLITTTCILVCIAANLHRSSSTNNSSEFINYFSKCNRQLPKFDECIREALNAVRPYFKMGVPELHILSFDPFFIKEVPYQAKGLGYSLSLHNVFESGWTISKVTEFISEPKHSRVRYSQEFPDKRLQGEWILSNNVLPDTLMKGIFNLTLIDYKQTTTLSLPREGNSNLPKPSLKVSIQAEDCGDMNLLIRLNRRVGTGMLGTMINRLIKVGWRPGFEVLKPTIDKFVSSAFTEIFNEVYKNLPLSEIIKN